MDYAKRALNYIDGVMAGTIIVSKYTEQTFKRHFEDLENMHESGWYFDKEASVKVMKFIGLLKHTKGAKHAGKNFILEPWQCAIIYILFGWKKTKDDLRRFSEAYIEIPKKNGKTAFLAGVLNYLLVKDGEPEAEVYCAATKKDQAKICFDQAKSFIEKNSDLMAYTRAKFVTNNIAIPSSGSKMEPIGRDSLGLDGINPSAAGIDEYHEWKTDDVKDSIKSATVSRLSSMLIHITTAGYNKTFPCFEYRKFCIDVLFGVKEQSDVFVIIYTLDDGDDWHDEANWEKANPNYGVSVEADNMRTNFKQAVNRGGRTEVTFKTKNLNIWVDAPETWISDDIITACDHGITDADLAGQVCYAGLDLASHVDINALALYFPDVKGKPRARFYFWVPESKVIERQDRVDYRLWVEQGHIIMTPGDVIDIDQQIFDMADIFNTYDVQMCAYDPAKAYHGVVQGLQKEGFENIIKEYPQGIRYMSEPTREIEREITAKEIDLMSNPVIRWMFRNVITITDTNDNIKVDKKKSQDKIDGVVALANAKGAHLSTEADAPGKPYENHTLRIIEL